MNFTDFRNSPLTKRTLVCKISVILFACTSTIGCLNPSRRTQDIIYDYVPSQDFVSEVKDKTASPSPDQITSQTESTLQDQAKAGSNLKPLADPGFKVVKKINIKNSGAGQILSFVAHDGVVGILVKDTAVVNGLGSMQFLSLYLHKTDDKSWNKVCTWPQFGAASAAVFEFNDQDVFLSLEGGPLYRIDQKTCLQRPRFIPRFEGKLQWMSLNGGDMHFGTDFQKQHWVWDLGQSDARMIESLSRFGDQVLWSFSQNHSVLGYADRKITIFDDALAGKYLVNLDQFESFVKKDILGFYAPDLESIIISVRESKNIDFVMLGVTGIQSSEQSEVLEFKLGVDQLQNDCKGLLTSNLSCLKEVSTQTFSIEADAKIEGFTWVEGKYYLLTYSGSSNNHTLREIMSIGLGRNLFSVSGLGVVMGALHYDGTGFRVLYRSGTDPLKLVRLGLVTNALDFISDPKLPFFAQKMVMGELQTFPFLSDVSRSVYVSGSGQLVYDSKALSQVEPIATHLTLAGQSVDLKTVPILKNAYGYSALDFSNSNLWSLDEYFRPIDVAKLNFSSLSGRRVVGFAIADEQMVLLCLNYVTAKYELKFFSLER